MDAAASSPPPPAHYDLEVLQHAARKVITRVVEGAVPDLRGVVVEGNTVAESGRRWSAARKVVLASRLSVVSGAIEQLELLLRLVEADVRATVAGAGRYPTPAEERRVEGGGRVAEKLRKTVARCRAAEAGAIDLMARW
jgi:hypothetical protein